MPIRGRGDNQVRYGRILGLVFIVGGFVVLGLGWAGAARVACIDCQFPYFISGGATGLGLIFVGGTLLALAQMRESQLTFGQHVDRLNQTVARASGLAAAGKNGYVIAGPSTYHRPDCRLVQGKDNLEKVSVATAQMSGLSPCRVCNPAVEDAPATRSEAGRPSGV